MSRFTNLPMSEYESALWAAIVIILDTIVRLGADSAELKRRLERAAQESEMGGSTNGAAMLRNLIRCIPD
jgi:hypothetical protein